MHKLNKQTLLYVNTLHFHKINTKHTLHVVCHFFLSGFTLLRCKPSRLAKHVLRFGKPHGLSSAATAAAAAVRLVFFYHALDEHKPHSVNILIQLYHFSTISNPAHFDLFDHFTGRTHTRSLPFTHHTPWVLSEQHTCILLTESFKQPTQTLTSLRMWINFVAFQSQQHFSNNL